MDPSLLHVLIVDSSPEDRQALQRLLTCDTPGRYTIAAAERGEQALALCRATPPDCVLLDQDLPDREGLAVLTALRDFTDVPAVLLTGVGDEALALEAFERGAQDYLDKATLTPARLHLSIQRAVAGVRLARERDHALARLTVVDITQTKRTEAALRASEARYRAMFEQNAAVQMLIDPGSGAIVDANSAAVAFYGYPRETLLAMPITAINQFTPVQVRAEMEAARREERNHFHFPHRLASGAVHAVEVFSSPIEVEGRQLLYSIIHDETERVRAEQALRVSQQNLASLIENTDGSIWSVDTQYRLIVGNRLFHQNVGAPLGRAIRPGESLVALPLAQEALDDWRAWYDRALGGATFGIEVSTRFTSEPCTVEYRFSPIRTADGTVTGATVVGRDITAQQQAEATIARLAERLELATRAAHIGVWDWDIGRNQLVWDARMYALYGVRPEDFPGAYEAWLQGLHPDDRAANDLISAQARRGERPYDTTFRVVWPDGSVRVLKADGEVVWDGEGRPQRMIGVNYDITERTQAEAELHRAVARLETLHIIDQAILGAQSAVEMAALVIRHLHRLLHCDLAAVLIDEPGQAEHQLVAASDGPPDPAARDALIAISTWYRDHRGPPPQPWQVAEQSIPAELARHAAVLRPPGTGALLVIPLQAQGTLIGTLVLSRVAHDSFGDDHLAITGELADQIAVGLQGVRLRDQLARERAQLAQRVAERTADLSLANAELARAARLKDEFLANMSHELRTPLNAILGRAELLHEQIYGPLSEAQQQAIQSIDTSGQHLLALITDILDLSKVEAGKIELELAAVDINLVCQQSRQLVVERATRKRLTLTTTLDPQVSTVWADALRLKQILVNLLSNAVKFTPEGGQLGLEVQGDAAQQTVTFTVWDTGIGIAPEDQGRLFQPFVQLDSTLNRQYAGTGLGLALVLRLAELHGGGVALESRLGAGSRFSVTLPWVQPEAGDLATPTAGTGAAAPLAMITMGGMVIDPVILLAEDQEENSRLLCDILTAAGYRVVVAYNGAQAVALAEDLRPALILMDIQMPVLDGLEAIRRLRAGGLCDIPIIALTALAMPGDRERCLAAGANAYLAKPVSLRALLPLIASYIRPVARSPE